jgi:di/tricarboxylate transporter
MSVITCSTTHRRILFLLFLLLFLLSVGPGESRLTYCSLPRFIVLTPLFGIPFHLQRRSKSDGVRDLYQRKKEGREMADEI